MNEWMRNRWVVGILAAVAVCLMVYQFWPHSPVSTRRTTKVAGKAAASTKAKSAGATGSGAKESRASTASAAEKAAPVQPADRVYLAEHFDLWRDSPKRDPFGGPPPKPKRRPVQDIPPASERLSIKAVWLQTGQKLAVINGQLLAEGDRILDYTIQSIGDDHVWVVGPLGREKVPFELGKSSAAKPAGGSSTRSRSNRSRSRR
ncbi:MAG: hypothetical protein D6766_07810 [Verrucomicrobia bacterium]|nr:MAG: hypothetical protein D6766_07810 [Verrucomicrobiota bacterium]